MKSLLCTILLIAAAAELPAATNEYVTLLQQGLFEEEANRNIPAAMRAYRSLIEQFEADRALAATALYRLAECHLKQGDTNAAAGLYERLERNFSDQAALFELSRQRLVAMGRRAAPGGPSGVPVYAVGAAPADHTNRMAALVERLSDLKGEELRQAARALREPGLDAILQRLVDARQRLASLRTQYTDQHPRVREEAAAILSLEQQADATVAALLNSWRAQLQTEAAPADARTAEEQRILALIRNSPDLINAPYEKGVTLLEAAAADGKLSIVRLLLEHGAAVNGVKQPGPTPLHYAAANGHKAVAEFLLAKGADVNAVTRAGITPLHIAAQKGYDAVAQTLLEKGAEINAVSGEKEDVAWDRMCYSAGKSQSPLHLAAKAGQVQMVGTLLTKGAKANLLDADGRTAMSYAAEGRYRPVVDTLLKFKADPNAGTMTLPLQVAAQAGDVSLGSALLEAGADPALARSVRWQARWGTRLEFGTRAGDPVSSLLMATAAKQPEMTALLIKGGADPKGTAPDGTPLTVVALADPPTLEVLLKGGADPDYGGEGRDPLLIQAVRLSNPATVRILLDYKADPNAEGRENRTALHIAMPNKLEIASMLLNAGADVNARDAGGQTSLHYAVQYFNREAIVLLLKNKADPNLMDIQGRTPLDYAKSQIAPSPNQGIPTRALRPAGLQPEEVMSASDAAELLRQYGAKDELPRLDRIMVQRPSSGHVASVLSKDTTTGEAFTALECVAIAYQLFETGGPDQGFWPMSMAFPDFSRTTIRKPAPGKQTWTEQQVDLTPLIQEGNCAADIRVGWGDVIEVPEATHPINLGWHGFSDLENKNIKECLTRSIRVVVGTKVKDLILEPAMRKYAARPASWQGERTTYFWLKSLLQKSTLVLSSSDLSRVKVTRKDPDTGETKQWTFDCSPNSTDDDLWLKNGDVVEVPERLATGN